MESIGETARHSVLLTPRCEVGRAGPHRAFSSDGSHWGIVTRRELPQVWRFRGQGEGWAGRGAKTEDTEMPLGSWLHDCVDLYDGDTGGRARLGQKITDLRFNVAVTEDPPTPTPRKVTLVSLTSLAKKWE